MSVPTFITVTAQINVSPEKAWELWTTPSHVSRWNFASSDWHCPQASNELKKGGTFTYTMAAKDESFAFDFAGVFDNVVTHSLLESTIDDGRTIKVTFEAKDGGTFVTEIFEAETQNPIDLQQQGWQAILNNFKTYAESHVFKKLKFIIEINRPKEIVYKTMLEDATYREWTAIFQPTSHYIGKWEKGEKMLFIGIKDDGTKEGMVSRIAEIKSNEFVSIEHVGMISGDTEILTGPDIEAWAGALENYTFESLPNGSTRLTIDLDSNEEFAAYFEGTYPNALDKLKEICEQ